MKVLEIIDLLKDYADLHGDDADVSVYDYEGICRDNIILRDDQIVTMLTCDGPESEF